MKKLALTLLVGLSSCVYGEQVENSARIEYITHKQDFVLDSKGDSFLVYLFRRAVFENCAIAVSPDLIFFLINLKIAEHVRKNPDLYEKLFSTEENKVVIKVRADDFLIGKENDWSRIVPQFTDKLKTLIPKTEVCNLFEHSFSTSDKITKDAGRIVLMAAADSFYSYVVETRYFVMEKMGLERCKILGNTADWNLLETKIFELKKLFAEMGEFWDYVSDLARFISKQVTNQPFTWLSAETSSDLIAFDESGKKVFGKLAKLLSEATCYVEFKWIYLGKELNMKFVSGIISHKMAENDENCIEPVLGWAVLGPFN